MHKYQCSVSEPVSSPIAASLVFSRFAKKRVEHFLVCTLDSMHKPIHTYIVSIGLVNKTLVSPREVFWYAIKDMASAIVIGHNHPSGSPVPSPDDLSLTSRLKSAGELLGIPVLDHIIVSRSGYSSLLENSQF